MLNEQSQINFNYLKFFIEAAECSSLQEVADKMGYEAPNVSASISGFEKQLGVKLFTRNPLKLTDTGKEIYDAIIRGYRDIEFINIIARNNKDIDFGKIDIGCPMHLMNAFMFNRVKKALNEHENLKIELDCESSYPKMLKKLKNNKLQMSILDFIPLDENTKDLEIKEIYKSEYIFVAKDEIKINDIKELQNYKYINNYDYRSSSIKLKKCLEKHDVTLDLRIICPTEELKVKAAKEGLGIAYVIKDSVKKELEKGELYEVKLPIELPKTSINLVYVKDRLTKVDKKFIKDYIDVNI